MKSESVFKALADEQRRAILKLLRGGEMSAGDLAAQLAISAGTVSHHLNLLKQAELVRMRRAGQQRIYELNTSIVEELLTLLADYFPFDRTPGGE